MANLLKFPQIPPLFPGYFLPNGAPALVCSLTGLDLPWPWPWPEDWGGGRRLSGLVPLPQQSSLSMVLSHPFQAQLTLRHLQGEGSPDLALLCLPGLGLFDFTSPPQLFLRSIPLGFLPLEDHLPPESSSAAHGPRLAFSRPASPTEPQNPAPFRPPPAQCLLL